MHSLDASRVPPEVITLCRRLQSAGFEAFVVGGSVRDMLLGRPVSDWDVATAAPPQRVRQIFSRTIPTGLQHGTVTVLLGSETIEVTTFRGEGAYTDGRHPDHVEFVTDLGRDLERRDFTINAIAFDPVSGALHDPLDGRGDLARRHVRAVGAARERFDEDGLRSLRAVRFASVLNFEIEERTLAAIPETLSRFRLVSAERVRVELLKLLDGSKVPSRGIELLRRTELLGEILPELLPCVGLKQNAHHSDDVWTHTLKVVDGVPSQGMLRLAALLHDVGKPLTVAPRRDDPTQNTFYRHDRKGAAICDQVAQRLVLSKRQRVDVCHLVRHHLFALNAGISDAGVRRFVRRVGVDSLDDLFELRRADVVCRPDGVAKVAALAAFRSRVDAVLREPPLRSVRDLAVDGEMLKHHLERPAGPWLGELLRGLLERVIEEPALNDRARLLAIARELQEE